MSLESSVAELVEESSKLISTFNEKKQEIDDALATMVGTVVQRYEGASYTVNVGASGDFETINDALNHLHGFKEIFNNSNARRMVINLLSGFVMQEQIIINGAVDFSYVEIVSEDDEVIVDTDYLTRSFFGARPLIGANLNGFLPLINVLFNMQGASKAQDMHGVLLYNYAKCFFYPGKGVKNAGGHGAYLQNSLLMSSEAEFSNAGSDGFRVDNNSNLYAPKVVLVNAAGNACRANNFSRVNIDEANVSGCLNNAIHATDGVSILCENLVANNIQGNYGIYAYMSDVYASGITVSGVQLGYIYASGHSRVSARSMVGEGSYNQGVFATDGSQIVIVYGSAMSGETESSSDIVVSNGGVVYANNAVGGTSVSPNTLTPSGIIYQ